MGWQKTFTLPRKSKGCHLVTNEVVSQISEGLQGVQVNSWGCVLRLYTFAHLNFVYKQIGMLFLFMYVILADLMQSF